MCKGWLQSVLMREREIVPKQVLELRERLEQIREISRENLETNQICQMYNHQAKDHEFKEGDWVLVLLPDNNHKLLSRWQGLSRWSGGCVQLIIR